MNPHLYRFAYYLGPPMVRSYLGLLRLTCRVEVIKGDTPDRVREQGSPGIYASWHGRAFYPAYHFAHRRANIIISMSRDGELSARIAERLGHRPVRGSSSRGGASAFRALLRELGTGHDVVITPDGPRGPREKVQIGVVALARHTGYPVIPVSYDASRRIRLRSWDRFLIPLPFSRIRIVFGEPVEPADDSDEFRRRVEAGLHEVTRNAEEAFGHEDEDDSS